MDEIMPTSHEKDSEASFLSEALADLENITVLLARRAHFAFLFTTLNIVFTLGAQLLFLYSQQSTASLVVAFTSIIITSPLCIFLIWQYENWRNRGDLLFEEISDQLQWHVVSQRTNPDIMTDIRRPDFRARTVLRSFARITHLPFVPGRFGPASYLVLNLILILISIAAVGALAYHLN